MELNNEKKDIINVSNNHQQSTMSAIITDSKGDIGNEIGENSAQNVINIDEKPTNQSKEIFHQENCNVGVSSNINLDACSKDMEQDNLLKQNDFNKVNEVCEMDVTNDTVNNLSSKGTMENCSVNMGEPSDANTALEQNPDNPCSDCHTPKNKTKKSESPKVSSKKIKKEKTPVIAGALSQLLDYGMSDSEDSDSDSVSLSDSSDTNSDLSDELAEKIEIDKERLGGDRRDVFSTDDSSTYYDSDSSSDGVAHGACAITPIETVPASEKPKPEKKMNSTVTKGELTLEDLPAIEQLQISVPEQDCVQIGTVSSIVEQLVIVQSMSGMPAYDIDTLLFLDRGNKPLGRIFDVLGPVTEPFYAVRFNSYEQAVEAGIKPGTPVFCAPYNSQHTAYVFVSELLKMKGSDASWKHNNEPPDMFLDYSDDEQEAAARRLRSGKSKDSIKSNSLERNKKFERQMNNKNILMNERFNAPSTSRRPQEPDRKSYQPLPGTPQNWSVPQPPRPMQRPEFCMPQNYGYFNQYNFGFPVMPQFGMAPMVAPSVFHPPQAFNPHVPPPIMRPQPVSYFPNPRHPRWAPPNVIQPPRGNFGNGMNQ